MGRVTGETAYQDIQALLERGDFATAEKLLKKFSQDLTEGQLKKLESVRRSAGRRRNFSRQLEALRRSGRPRFLRSAYRWSLPLIVAGALAYIAFPLVWMRWLPPIKLHGTGLMRLIQSTWHFLPLYLYFYFPAFVYDTRNYLQKLHRWSEVKSEPAEVLEIRQEDRTGQHFRSGQVYHYQASYALVRPLERRKGEPETMRFYLYENANGRSLIQSGEDKIHPWSFHPGDIIPLYRDRTGFPSLTHHTRRSMTRDWLWKLGCHGGWLALFYLLFILNALSK